jgi:nucleolar complex protein 2
LGCLLIYFVCRNNEVEDFKDISLDIVFGEEDSDMDGDDSDSDGYLSEVLNYVMPTLFLLNLIWHISFAWCF